jgi:hypothetical protein
VAYSDGGSDAALVLEVKISADLASVDVMHHGRRVTIMRNQDQGHSISPEYAKTSRKCSPFSIQSCELVPGVKTVAELENAGAVLQRLLVRTVVDHDRGTAENRLSGAQKPLVSWWYAGLGRLGVDHPQAIRQLI